MTGDLLFSVIVPTYNTPYDKISRCIDSILFQTYDNFELIIVNDGSDDRYTRDIKTLSERDPRIRLVFQENKGAGAARNLGVEIAGGEYAVFVDADDVVCNYMLEDAYEAIKKTNADIVCGVMRHEKTDSFTIPDYGDQPVKYCLLKTAEQFDQYINNILGYECEELQFNNGFISDGPVSKAYRMSIAKEVKADEEKFWDEDTIWNLNITKKCGTICISNRIWYLYIMNRESQSHQYRSNCPYEFKYRLEQERQLIKTMWPNCLNGLYFRDWRNTYLLFDTYLAHKKNKASIIHRCEEFREAITQPAYIEMLENARFDKREPWGKRLVKELLRWLCLHGPGTFAFLLWLCMSKIRKAVHF